MALGVLEVLEVEALVFVEEGVVFLAVAGLEARCRFEADGLAAVAVVFLVAAVFTAALLTAFDSGSVFKEAEAGTASATGMDAICLAASRQFGKKSSIRWREMEFARRQRGQCASWWFWFFSSMVTSAVSISARPTVNGV
ncbi:MAG: hypothetical protein HYU84_02480 [Chloroflexi bacterium]|nr:hypothetical protein [Chloroflexota bacterium]